MPLTSFKGPANSSEIFQHLVGERIVCAFEDRNGDKVIILGSGKGIAFGGNSGSYWPISEEDCKKLIQRRQEELIRRQEELKAMMAELGSPSNPEPFNPEPSGDRFQREDPV